MEKGLKLNSLFRWIELNSTTQNKEHNLCSSLSVLNKKQMEMFISEQAAASESNLSETETDLDVDGKVFKEMHLLTS